MKTKRLVAAFTALEIAILMVILAVLAAIVVPGVMDMREKARTKRCRAQLVAIEDLKKHVQTTNVANRLSLVELIEHVDVTYKCPSGGTYGIGGPKEKAVCSHAKIQRERYSGFELRKRIHELP